MLCHLQCKSKVCEPFSHLKLGDIDMVDIRCTDLFRNRATIRYVSPNLSVLVLLMIVGRLYL
jgi:hypothetical protein